MARIEPERTVLLVLQLSNPYDVVPCVRYGGIGRVVGLLHETIRGTVSACAPGSTGPGVLAAREATAEGILDAAKTITDRAILAHSTEVADLAEEFFGPWRVVEMLHMPVDAEKAQALLPRKRRFIGCSAAQLVDLWALRPDARMVWHATPVVPAGGGTGGYATWVGRFCPEKGAEDAIEAAAVAGVPLVLLGSATNEHEAAYFEQVIRPRLGGQVSLVLHPESHERDRIVGDAVANLVPTRLRDSFGLVTIESAMVGTPVLGYPGGATRELLSTGIGKICHRIEDLAAGIEWAAANPEARTEVRQAAIEHFSPARQAAHIERIMVELGA